MILFIWLRFEDRLATWWQRQSMGRQALLSLAGPLILLLLMPPDKAGHYPNESGGTFAGLLIGAGLGSILEQRTVRFRVEGVWWRRSLRYVLGIVVAATVYVGGSFIPDMEPWSLDVAVRLLRYALLGLVVIWVAPWLFVKLHLADSETELLTNR